MARSNSLRAVACVPLAEEGDEGQRAVGLRQAVVERDGPPGRRLGARIGLLRPHQCVFAQQIVAVGQPDIGLGVFRIAHHGLGEAVDRLLQPVGRAGVPVRHAGQIEPLGLRIGDPPAPLPHRRGGLGAALGAGPEEGRARDGEDHRGGPAGEGRAPGWPAHAGRRLRLRFLGLRAGQPLAQLAGVGIDLGFGARHPANGQAALGFPPAHRARVAVQEGADLLPRLQPPVRAVALCKPPHVRSCPILTSDAGAGAARTGPPHNAVRRVPDPPGLGKAKARAATTWRRGAMSPDVRI